jgi:hypothetical protein
MFLKLLKLFAFGEILLAECNPSVIENKPTALEIKSKNILLSILNFKLATVQNLHFAFSLMTFTSQRPK